MSDLTPTGMRDAGRLPFDRIGVAVLNELVEAIVSGRVQPGETLPPEAVLSQQFGVSRTVIRESMKRLQEKGMVTVAQGRGTHVNAMSAWNLLDPLVLPALIGHDDALGILDDLSVVRGALEAAMAGALAARRTDEVVETLRASLTTMQENMADSAAFRQADVRFHIAVMELSGNLLAENIARVLFDRALESTRYHGVDPEHAFEMTMQEHERIVEAIDAGDADAARRAMDEHILGSWERRRLPTLRRGKEPQD
ncbi:FadR/GntR family transcriptional regulator [Microbacterium sp. CFBP9034]|uniref:FadR/GntR family transcriptional regulator n=1 Tax=Microbacterium sp. CFBP9034 TaxID=3096540 RepID=UPI002A6AA4F2|nr:FCD domain-containing protein [Microbacterium sp. CFBP9034]MDY0908238.1 FCD domain-containing protein [Microbacterium sp. CFBP9034]